MREIEKVREIFLTDVDEETREENLERIREWEEGIANNRLYLEWQNHDVSEQILKQIREIYKDIAIILYSNRDLTEGQRYSFWAKQDAIQWLITLLTKDSKGELDRIEREIQQAINATK